MIKILPCHGCLSIKNNAFPFTDSETNKGNCIDQEGCGVDGETYLKIKYCPVCGNKISND